MSLQLEERMTRFEEHLAAILHHIKDLRVSNRGIEGRLDRIEERLDRIEERLDRIEERLDRIEERLDALESRMSAVETDLTAMKAHQEQADERLHVALEKVAKEMEELRDAVGGDYMRLRVYTKATVRDLESTQLELKERLDDLDARLRRLEERQ